MVLMVHDTANPPQNGWFYGKCILSEHKNNARTGEPTDASGRTLPTSKEREIAPPDPERCRRHSCRVVRRALRTPHARATALDEGASGTWQKNDAFATDVRDQLGIRAEKETKRNETLTFILYHTQKLTETVHRPKRKTQNYVTLKIKHRREILMIQRQHEP